MIDTQDRSAFRNGATIRISYAGKLREFVIRLNIPQHKSLFMFVRKMTVAILVISSPAVFAQQQQSTNAEQLVGNLLKTNDADGDGVITQSEAKAQLKNNFDRVDQDSNGSIDRGELTALAKRLISNRNRSNTPRRQGIGGMVLPENVELEVDIAYHDEHERQKLDLMLPKEDSKTARPAIVFIHGGGWRSGDKGGGMWRSLPLQYASKGYVCISVNYRLTPDRVNVFGCIEDCRCAVRWLRANTEKYNVDPNRIGAFGNSAGGHLVALLGLTPDESDFDGDAPYAGYSSGFQAVCCGAPPTNFMDYGKKTNNGFTKLAGSDDGVKRASPVTWVSKEAPPFLIIHGTKDTTVPVKNSDDLNAALKRLGTDVTYMRIDGAGHGVVGQKSKETFPAMEKFFDRVLAQD
ncbi:MAG: alpha/beta hydrolase fold domain-containing protein [Planctomycetota bacterium]